MQKVAGEKIAETKGRRERRSPRQKVAGAKGRRLHLQYLQAENCNGDARFGFSVAVSILYDHIWRVGHTSDEFKGQTNLKNVGLAGP